MAETTKYDQFCDLLWAYARFKGLGATDEDLRNTPYPYSEMWLRYNFGKCSIDDVLNSFAKAVHSSMRRGRRISEVE